MPARGKAKRATKPERLSLRAFAAVLRVSHPAVRKAIRSGRLLESIGRDARGPFVRDVALAKREWAAGVTKAANNGNGGGRGHATPGAAAAPPGGSLVEAQLRLADQRSVSLELANKRKRGELLDAATVERENFEVARVLRERILNVPDRLADLAPGVRDRIRAELRQALGSIADEIERE